ncbi:MAG: hypothetical protein ACI9OJ_003192 [Myxococcota bacterium]
MEDTPEAFEINNFCDCNSYPQAAIRYAAAAVLRTYEIIPPKRPPTRRRGRGYAVFTSALVFFGLTSLSIGIAACSRDEPAPTVEQVNSRLDRIAAAAPPEPERVAVPDAGAADVPVVRKKRERLPSPLRPRSRPTHVAPDAGGASACTQLVNKVCLLLTEGSEECGEARDRLKHPRHLQQDRCLETLEWYEKRVENPKRVRPCRLAAQIKCRVYGSDSPLCKQAKRDFKLMRKRLGHACKADLLLFKGLP